MILAQSRLQRLNGSKMIYQVLLLASALNFSSCGSSNKATAMPIHPAAPPEKQLENAPKVADKIAPEPKAKKPKKEYDSLNRFYPETIKAKYDIAIVLPFFLNYEELTRQQKNSAAIAADYYRGILMAADSLKYWGANLDIHVLDLEADTLNPRAITDNIKKVNPDLILGPLSDQEVRSVSAYTEANHYNLAAPVASIDTNITEYYYLENNPKNEVYGRFAASYIKKHFVGYKVFIVEEQETKCNLLVKAFKDSAAAYGLKVTEYIGANGAVYRTDFDLADSNVVFIASKNHVFVSSVMSQLQISDKKIVVLGMDIWKSRAIDANLWDKFDMHILTPYDIDYRDAATRRFVLNFRQKFNDEPNEYAIRGYDDMMYYGLALKSYGKYFENRLPEQKIRLLHSIYNFQRSPESGIWENTSLHMLEFHDFQLKKVE